MNRKIIDAIWITASVIVLLAHNVVKLRTSPLWYYLIIGFFTAQLVLGTIVNPIIRHLLKVRQERLQLELARTLLGVSKK